MWQTIAKLCSDHNILTSILIICSVNLVEAKKLYKRTCMFSCCLHQDSQTISGELSKSQLPVISFISIRLQVYCWEGIILYSKSVAVFFTRTYTLRTISKTTCPQFLGTMPSVCPIDDRLAVNILYKGKQCSIKFTPLFPIWYQS